MSDDDLKKLSTSRQTWRAALKPGDDVDVCVMGDNRGGKVKGWQQAKVERVDGEYVHVTFPHFPADWTAAIETWSTDLQPFESRTKEDYAWRREVLMSEDREDRFLIDCHDDYKWEEASVLGSQ